MTDYQGRALVDPSRATVLGVFACGHELQAGVAVRPDGSEWLWLLVPGGDLDDTPRGPWPDHERTGPLPATYRHRLAQHRCGQPRLDGRPCRTPVARSGLTCAHHAQPSDQGADA